MNKKIILCCTSDYEISELIKVNLEFFGYEVFMLKSNYAFKYEKKQHKIMNFLLKIFNKSKLYKNKLKEEFNKKKQNEILDNIQEVDYVLCIRSDFFSNEILIKLKTKSQKMYAYHYDGISRDKSVLEKIDFFDKFYVFDKKDILENKNYKLFPLTNFYFDFPDNLQVLINFDFYFLGSFHKSRMEIIDIFHQKIKHLNYNSKIEIVVINKYINQLNDYAKANYTIINTTIPFSDYIENIKKSKFIVDFVIDEHKGLSFRIFESIKYGKKLVTNNLEIKKYDFYLPNNIFIFNDDKIEDLQTFLTTEYFPLEESIYKKYAFTNWINNIVESQNKISIHLP